MDFYKNFFMSQELPGLATREIWFCFLQTRENLSVQDRLSGFTLLTGNLVYKICLWKKTITDEIHCELDFSNSLSKWRNIVWVQKSANIFSALILTITDCF